MRCEEHKSKGKCSCKTVKTYTMATTETAVSSKRVATSATNCTETAGEAGRLGIAVIPNSSLPSCSPLSRLLISTNEIPVPTKRVLLRPQKRPTVNCSRAPSSPSQSVAALARSAVVACLLLLVISRRRRWRCMGLETCFYLSEKDPLLWSFSIVSVVCFSIFFQGVLWRHAFLLTSILF